MIGTNLYYSDNSIAANDLVIQGLMASDAIALTCFPGVSKIVCDEFHLIIPSGAEAGIL